VAGKRPINADVAPPASQPDAEAKTPPSHSSEIDHTRTGSTSDAQRGRGAQGKKRRQRKPIPAALKAIAGLVVVAVVFLVAAILGGGGSSQGPDEPAPAPAPSGESSEKVETPAAKAAEELGYPSFATNNTTRVGGSDPATTAAGVALAVFPSTTPAQRPAAVTLVDEADWQGAIAASVLMATPIKAPMLVTTGGDLPDPTSQALEALDPQGSKATGKAQVFAIGDAARPDGLKVTEIKPGEPAAVAASVAKLRDKLLGGPPQHIVLAPEGDSAFAMPAAAWAARSGDPVLFTDAEKLPAATVAALKRHTQVPVYLIGPSSAIPSDVFREVARIDKRVRRVSGEDPVENAIALARYADGGFGWNVNDPGHGFVVARSDSPLDAALAAPLSASGTWGPLLLTDDADTLPKALRKYLLDVKPGYTTDPTRAFYNHVWVIGDQEAIDVNQQAEIDQLAELAKIGGEP
jgi:hypothetical protein